jgi:hypothetical protein
MGGFLEEYGMLVSLLVFNALYPVPWVPRFPRKIPSNAILLSAICYLLSAICYMIWHMSLVSFIQHTPPPPLSLCICAMSYLASLPTAHNPLLTAHSSQLTAHSSQLTAPHGFCCCLRLSIASPSCIPLVLSSSTSYAALISLIRSGSSSGGGNFVRPSARID